MHPKCQQFRGNPWAGVRGHPVGVARVHHLTEDHEFDVIKDNCLVGLGFGLMIQSGSWNLFIQLGTFMELDKITIKSLRYLLYNFFFTFFLLKVSNFKGETSNVLRILLENMFRIYWRWRYYRILLISRKSVTNHF